MHIYKSKCVFFSPACACADNYYASLIRLCARLYVQQATAAGGGGRRENVSLHQFGFTGAQTAREQAAAASDCSRDGGVKAPKGHRNLSGSNAESWPGETIPSQQRALCDFLLDCI